MATIKTCMHTQQCLPPAAHNTSSTQTIDCASICVECVQAGDMWGSSVFQHLVSFEPAAQACTSALGQRIEKHTSALQELLLQLQFCSIEDRPTLAYSLRSQFMSTFNALCAAEAPEPVRDSTFLSEPTQISELADRSALTSLGESLPMDAAAPGECSDMRPQDPSFDHCLRPHTEFPTDSSYINSKVKNLFFELEGGAKVKVRAAAVILVVYTEARFPGRIVFCRCLSTCSSFDALIPHLSCDVDCRFSLP